MDQDGGTTSAARLRCALCHGNAEGLLEGCACGAVTHLDCRRDLGRCPTLGCSAPSAAPASASPADASPPRGPDRSSRSRPAWLAALRVLEGLGLTFALGLGVFFLGDVLWTYLPERPQARAHREACERFRLAARRFKLVHARWPRTLAEAVGDPGRDPAGRPYRVAWRGTAAWAAVETEEGLLVLREGLLFHAPPTTSLSQAAAPIRPAPLHSAAATCGLPPAGALELQRRLSER